MCTRTIYLPPTVMSQFSTLTYGLVKSTASLADVILFHANHRGHTFHFYLYRVSELNTHKYLRECYSRCSRKYCITLLACSSSKGSGGFYVSAISGFTGFGLLLKGLCTHSPISYSSTTCSTTCSTTVTVVYVHGL